MLLSRLQLQLVLVFCLASTSHAFGFQIRNTTCNTGQAVDESERQKGSEPQVHADDCGNLHISSGHGNGSVFIDGVNVLQRLKTAEEEIQTLKTALNQSTSHLRTCRDALARYGPVSGVYTLQPDPGSPPFSTICDQEGEDGGGWMLAIVYSASQVPIATLSEWPSVWEQPSLFDTRMYKGSLAAFSEAREEIKSGEHSVWGSNLTEAGLDAIRQSYAFSKRKPLSHPDCRLSYTANSTVRHCGVACGTSISGWQCDVHGTHCWAGRGFRYPTAAGSGVCLPENPNGEFWSRLYVR